MPSAFEQYASDPDYQNTNAHSQIPPPQLEHPSAFKQRERGGQHSNRNWESNDRQVGGGYRNDGQRGGQDYGRNGDGRDHDRYGRNGDGWDGRDRGRHHSFPANSRSHDGYRDEPRRYDDRGRDSYRQDSVRDGRYDDHRRDRHYDDRNREPPRDGRDARDMRDGRDGRQQHYQQNYQEQHYQQPQQQQHQQPHQHQQQHHSLPPRPAAPPQSKPAQQPSVKFEWLARPKDKKPLTENELVVVVEKTQLPDYSLFCIAPMVTSLHKIKTQASSLTPQAFTNGRRKSNPHETINRSVFVNRSAVKLASIDTLFQSPSPNDPNPFKGFVLSGKNGKFRFADVCAGPGGFVEYLLWRSNEAGIDGAGWGMTLRGEQDFDTEKFNEVAKLKAEKGGFKAVYGVDGSGDVTRIENLRAFEDEVRSGTDGEGVDLFMGDGGFSTVGDELHQEFHTKRILLAQILSMFMTLRKGGNLILKTFDLLTPFSAGILYILHQNFSHVAVVKPVTSRPANSERYILCKHLESSRPTVIVEHLTKTLESLNGIWERPGGVDVSSHTEPPKGFVGLEERVELGWLDVTDVVSREALFADEDFVDYLSNSNMKMCLKQTESLKLLIKLANDAEPCPFDQEETRVKCLREWNLPV
ncbi:FtsJ methyltransferase domain-containing protein 2 [Phlyctochytrium planicorne]|nr:FtsJ methyltransferase domain-containing protein 2 [Phlyctochytrium planicorne]